MELTQNYKKQLQIDTYCMFQKKLTQTNGVPSYVFCFEEGYYI